ncbi:hypothetical protein RYH75_01825 [Stenotrophomonas geniculata]|uniref:lipopolysaccharide biosynthesis protein n=1 Tax=Stenotrophomonas geniculata TaxID=86188 RepID=UPI00031A463F|nr:oligosaccharide flippase family protein [Stenotrophomonas geniculata]MDV6187999.1 hypothetical protein [Stenotrophomonas geniculata]
MLSRLLGISGMRGVGAVFTFLVSLLVGRLLDIDDAGRVLWAIAATSLLAVFARAGLDKAFMKLGAVESRSTDARSAAGLVIAAYGLRIVVGAVALAILLVAYGAWLDSTMHWDANLLCLAILSIAIAGIALANAAGTAAIGSGAAVHGTATISVLPSAIALAALAILLFPLAYAPSALIFSIAYTGGWLLAAAFAILTLRPPASGPKSAKVRIAEGETRPFAVIGMSNTLEQWLPTFIAGIFLSSADAAGFALSARLVAIIQLLMVSATSVYARTYATTSIKDLRGVAASASRSISLIGLPAIILLFIFAPQALSIFGPEYSQSSTLLRILLLGQAANMVMGTFSVALIMHNQVSRVAGIFAASSAIQLAVALTAAYIGSATLLAASSVAAVLIHTTACAFTVARITRSTGLNQTGTSGSERGTEK